MTKPRVLISDKMDPNAARIFEERGCQVDVITGESPEQLIARIGDYDGLAIRSSTKVTKAILAAAPNLKVIGRAGIGVDNVDIPAASAQGVVVMNTPFGNSITTAEHAIALMFALARQLPEANAQTQAGMWPKNGFMGVEVTGKTLGLIGAGNIGSIVASRALGLRMKVIAFDPFRTPERAIEMGVEKVDLDTLLARADQPQCLAGNLDAHEAIFGPHPSLRLALASGSCRASANISAIACSAVVIELPNGEIGRAHV